MPRRHDSPSTSDHPTPIVVNDNAAWCWFQDERALVDPVAGLLLVGSIASTTGVDGERRGGNVEVTVVDLTTGTADVVVLHERLESDDHDVPALWHRPDGRWLAMYTRHKTDDLTRWRISEPDDPHHWGPEQTFDWSPHTGGSGVTYANLHELDGRLYCFARAVNDDQCALISDDHGDTWRYAGKLFTRPKVGYVNGYTRYTSTPTRIDLITTDHHPRDYDNSVYHGFLDADGLHRTDGSIVDPHPLSGDAPSQADLTTLVAAGSTLPEDSRWPGVRLGHGWTVDLRRAADGTLAAIVSARADDGPAHPDEAAERFRPVLDHRFLYAHLPPGGEWSLHPLALAGAGLLPHEQDYTGLVAIDPDDLDSVYLSSAIDPRDDTTLPHHEIFHGRTADAGASWSWTPVTEHSAHDNLRPIVAPGDPSTVSLLWFRGSMASSQDYRCEAVLLRLPRVPHLPREAVTPARTPRH